VLDKPSPAAASTSRRDGSVTPAGIADVDAVVGFGRVPSCYIATASPPLGRRVRASGAKNAPAHRSEPTTVLGAVPPVKCNLPYNVRQDLTA